MTKKELRKWRKVFNGRVDKESNRLCKFYHDKFDRHHGDKIQYGRLLDTFKTDEGFESFISTFAIG